MKQMSFSEMLSLNLLWDLGQLSDHKTMSTGYDVMLVYVCVIRNKTANCRTFEMSHFGAYSIWLRTCCYCVPGGQIEK